MNNKCKYDIKGVFFCPAHKALINSTLQGAEYFFAIKI